MMIENVDESQKVAALIKHMTLASEILDYGGFDFWSSWLRRDLLRIRQFDVSGLEHFLSAFGGMGSINDVHVDSRPSSRGNDSNVELQHHLAQAYTLASDLMPKGA